MREYNHGQGNDQRADDAGPQNNAGKMDTQVILNPSCYFHYTILWEIVQEQWGPIAGPPERRLATERRPKRDWWDAIHGLTGINP